MKYYCFKLINSIFSLFFSERDAQNKLKKLLQSSPHPSILFVCKGNICRSPYGECYIKSISGHNIDIKSAGLETRDGLDVNDKAKSEARKRGIDLSSHKTTLLTEKLIDKYDIIFLMEPIQILKAVYKFPSKGVKKYILLGLLADPPLNTKILFDPYGRDDKIFETAFKTIESACNKINNLIKK